MDPGMKIKVNGGEFMVKKGVSIAQLLEQCGYQGKVSVWVDGNQLLSAEYPSRLIEDGEEIRILRLVAGG